MLFVVRGLPGSGKTYLSKKLRELEEKECGDAPRIISIDDYFMTVSCRFALGFLLS